MTNLLHRLRDRRGTAPDGFPSTYGDPLCHEAADEIERLLALLHIAQSFVEAMPRNKTATSICDNCMSEAFSDDGSGEDPFMDMTEGEDG